MDLYTRIEALTKSAKKKFEILQSVKEPVLFSSLESEDLYAKLLDERSLQDREAEIAKLCKDHQIRRIYRGDPLYPKSLLCLKDPPFCLYYKGKLERLHDQSACIAMVGSRRISNKSAEAAFLLGYQAGQAGLVVVSGFARGGDIAAHRGAIAARGASVAVLPAGLLHGYPREHQNYIYELLSHGGTILSEYPPDQASMPYLYPERNRIISALASHVVLFECARKSGALISLAYAEAQGKHCYVHRSASHSPGGLLRIAKGDGIISSLQELPQFSDRCAPLLVGSSSHSYTYSTQLEAEKAGRLIRFGHRWYCRKS